MFLKKIPIISIIYSTKTTIFGRDIIVFTYTRVQLSRRQKINKTTFGVEK